VTIVDDRIVSSAAETQRSGQIVAEPFLVEHDDAIDVVSRR
jgi:hypothetical protein